MGSLLGHEGDPLVVDGAEVAILHEAREIMLLSSAVHNVELSNGPKTKRVCAVWWQGIGLMLDLREVERVHVDVSK